MRRLLYVILFLPFFASAQCDPEGILLELQATTDLNGLLFGETGCIEAVTIGSPLTFTGGTLDITTGNLTAGSTKVAVTGGTGAVIGAGATVDVVPGNILLSTLGGSLNLSQIAQGGATTNQLLQWNGSTWTPATISTGSGTVTSVGLTMPSGFSVGSSPVTTSGTIAVTTTLNGPLRGNGSGFTTGNTSLTSEVSGILPIANGGTNLSALGTANQLLRVNSGATALEYFTPSFLTGNQTITLSGDVTGSGTTAITTTIANNAVTVAKMQTLAGLSVLGRSANSTGNMAAITGTAANQYLRVNSGGTALEWGAITTGNLTAGSTKVAVTGGTGAVIGSGSTVDVVPGNILLSTLGGTLNLSQINQGGATLNQVMQWNGTTWAPATATATTDLTFSGASSPVTLNSSTGTDVTHTAGTGISLTGTSSNMTITNTLPDVTVSLTGAGINAVTGTYPNFTITGTEVDGSVTNEAQTLSTSGTTSGILTLSTAGGAGGGTATIAAGTGITVAQSAGTITITNSSPATAGWLLDGNTIGSAKRIGSNDNFDVVVETNGTDRMWFDNAGTVSIGTTQLTTAALNINGLQTGTGMLISGGSSLVGPNFYTATGSGSGSTATVLSGVLSMLSGNVESIMKNTTTAGTGGGALFTVNVSPTATSNDAFFKWQTDGVTDWSMGIDNDDVDNLKLHRFSRPSDNDGRGTIELGYRTNDIGIAINKTGIGIATNGFYGIDVGGKVRTDQYVNNSLNLSGAAFATIAVGTAAGTSPTVDGVVTSVWGNGAHLKFTSGSSPTANGVICTVTLDTQYTFADCVPIMQGRSTNAGAFNYSCSYNSGTRVITCTLVGTLTASTVYEFNLLFFGRN